MTPKIHSPSPNRSLPSPQSYQVKRPRQNGRYQPALTGRYRKMIVLSQAPTEFLLPPLLRPRSTEATPISSTLTTKPKINLICNIQLLQPPLFSLLNQIKTRVGRHQPARLLFGTLRAVPDPSVCWMPVSCRASTAPPRLLGSLRAIPPSGPMATDTSAPALV